MASFDLNSFGLISFDLLSKDQQLVQPWKNGRGETRQIAIWPSAASFPNDTFDWRVSTALVSESGPFSTFANIDRQLLLLDGEGLEVRGAGFTLRPSSTEAVAFSGDLAVEGKLLNGAVRDFNVFTARGRARAKLRVESLQPQSSARFSPDCKMWMIFAADSEVRVTRLPFEGRAHELPGSQSVNDRDSLQIEREHALLVKNWSPGASIELSLTYEEGPSARVILVELEILSA